ncbi:TPA: dihydrodipicolinate synthase family protein [Citrobacter youngae]|uniref:dihydrodipicolinate synthase family protein n=1 Tax=Citrobacter TaxID=544 RepID=UPI000E14E15D|nr:MULTISPECIES: dihydrodipicolinate synthase family protein [Citrobacter]TKU05279.1 dihydrodipicolinate synthase family protein [Citrobacter sp. wls828]EIS7448604.1 dihydrodipicolinate synthase family protein [Citrobacter youngae]MBJ8399972.1 dihydrodipicolinate synthase family protein [Citrobacter youngae]MBJ8885502.1 dihydrodipicolinate synthase family protein [Citrobacter sp. FDAARGOS_156]MBJ8959448.1 dihydrodipicolinate synthase family protein [Citrobacter youngae]
MLNVFKGIFPPVPTIVDDNGELDRAGMAVMIDHVISNGADGMLILGSGGEFSHFSSEQRKQIAEFSLQHVAGRVPVLIGIACASTAETIQLGKHAEKAGAQGVLVVNPYYAKLSEEARFTHYKRIAEALNVPVFLYNFPELTGQDIGLNVITRLAREVPNIVGIKDTIDNISHTREIINQVHCFRPDFIIFSGYDEYLLDTLMLGGHGGIPATFNFAPNITRGIYQAVQQNDLATAKALQQQLSGLSPLYALEQPFFGVIKTAIKLSGVDISTAVVPPALPLNEEKIAQVKNILSRISV